MVVMKTAYKYRAYPSHPQKPAHSCQLDGFLHKMMQQSLNQEPYVAVHDDQSKTPLKSKGFSSRISLNSYNC